MIKHFYIVLFLHRVVNDAEEATTVRDSGRRPIALAVSDGAIPLPVYTHFDKVVVPPVVCLRNFSCKFSPGARRITL